MRSRKIEASQSPVLCGVSSGLDDLSPDRVADEVWQGVEFQLPHRGGAMRLHRLDAEVQEARDLLVAFAFGEELHNLAFARRQALGRWPLQRHLSPFEKAVQDNFRDTPGEVRLFLRQAFDGWNKLTHGIGLEQVAPGAST